MEFEKALKCFDGIPFFNGFSREEKRFLASMDCHMVSFKPGKPIIREGDIERSLFIIMEGTARVTMDKPPEVTVERLSVGAIFGEISLMDKRPRTTGVTAEDRVTLLQMNGEMIERLNPILLNRIKNQLIEFILHKLDHTILS